MDALTGLLSEVRSSGALIQRTVLTPPWSIRFTDRAPLTLVSMLRGAGWIVPDGGRPVAINEAEVALVVGPEPFVAANTPDALAPPTSLRSVSGHCSATDGTEMINEPPLGLRTCGEGVDGPIVLLTGSYQVWGRVSARLLRALPRVLVVPHAGELCPVLDLTVAEIERDTPGQQAVLDRLLDLLLLSALREWFALPGVKPPGWYRAMGDPVVGRALRLLHKYPARAWTVTDLAAQAGVSRATLGRRFTDLVGESPMAYLTSSRLCVAADLLEHTNATVDAIARQVGYESAFGLSVAFKRVYGTRPSQLRAALSA